MKLISLLCALWLAQISVGLAGNQALLGVGATTTVAAGYQGPGDVVSGAVAFWSCRAYSSAKKGTKAYQIKRASDSTTTDINSDATTGLCDTATPIAFCASTTCVFTKWYDQTGALNCTGAACDISNATGTQWLASVFNGVPCGVFSGSQIFSTSAAMSTLNGVSPGWTFVALANRSNALSFEGLIDDTNNSLYYTNATGIVNVFGGTNLATAAASFAEPAYHTFIGVVLNGAAGGAIVVDGSATTGNAGSGNVTGVINVGSTNFGGGYCEAGIWPVGMSPTQYGNLNTNMHSATNGWNF